MAPDPVAQTVVRMALAMWAADGGSDLLPHQRTWITDRLQLHTAQREPVPLTELEIRTLLPALLAWGEARRTIVGSTLRDQFPWALTPAPTSTPPEEVPEAAGPSALLDWLTRAAARDEKEAAQAQKGVAYVHRRHARS